MRFLFVDRILHSVQGEWIRGIKHVTADDFYLTLSESGTYQFIPSLIGETLGQLAAWNVMEALDFAKRPVAGVAARAVVHKPVYVGETLLLESYIDSLDDTAVQYHSIARVENDIVFTVDGALGPLLPMNDFIDDSVIRQQYAEINRPGEWLSPQFNSFVETAKSPFQQIGEWERGKALSFTFDAIIKCEPGVQLSAIKRVTRAAPYFPDHFPNKPVLPMTVLLECQLNLAKVFLKQSSFKHAYRISELRRIKMNEFVYPGDIVICHLSVKRQEDQELVLSFRSEVDGKRVCVMELSLGTVND